LCLFFNAWATAAGNPNAFSRLGGLQLATSRRNGVHTQAGNLSERAITAVTKPLRFETDVQSSLVLIEGTDQEIDVRVQLFRRRILARAT
jgi:hypothetical protein